MINEKELKHRVKKLSELQNRLGLIVYLSNDLKRLMILKSAIYAYDSDAKNKEEMLIDIGENIASRIKEEMKKIINQ